MADEATAATATDDSTDTATTDVEKEAFLERLSKESSKRKESDQRASKLEKDLADLKAQMEERESAGLPELDRMRKDLERAQKRAEEADQRATQNEQKVVRVQRERWVTAAAKDFADPDDASAFLNLDEIEDEKDAERAVKQLAKRKPHLLKAEDPKLPGRVLANGQAAATTATRTGGIDVVAEADQLSQSLAQFLKNRRT